MKSPFVVTKQDIIDVEDHLRQHTQEMEDMEHRLDAIEKQIWIISKLGRDLQYNFNKLAEKYYGRDKE